ncbi:MAG: hypothetical protein VB141_06165, partial [Burkholderia gladioli]
LYAALVRGGNRLVCVTQNPRFMNHAPLRKPASAAGEAGAPLQPAGYAPALRANLLVTHVLGRWHRYARSGFTKSPAEQADIQLQLILR